MDKKFKCRICGSSYTDDKTMIECEKNNTITKETLHIEGDIIRIKKSTYGNFKAKIVKKIIFDKFWGGIKYWHTVGFIVEIEDNFGNTFGEILTYEDYYEDVVKMRKLKFKILFNENI